MSYRKRRFDAKQQGKGPAAPPVFETLESRLLLAANLSISEFMAVNTDTLADQDGDFSDWIEIRNSGDTAQNLDGWHLKDDGNTWHFPAQVLEAGDYLVVFASGKNRHTAGQELHTDFSLKSGGEYLALTDNNNNIITEFTPQYPPQYDYVSYGFYEDTTVGTILPAGATAYYKVPTDGSLGLTWTSPAFNAAGWSSGPTGLGFSATMPGFAVTNYKANIGISGLASAEGVIITPSQQTSVWTENVAVFNYDNTSASGHYGSNRNVPGGAGQDLDNYVIKGTGRITIPAAGLYTFGVNSDDGCRLTIFGAVTTVVTNSNTPLGQNNIRFDGMRGAADTLGVFSFPTAGVYDLEVLYFEGGGGSGGELWAASGNKGSWNATDFDLVGDTANGGLAINCVPVGSQAGGNYADEVQTSVQSGMYQTNGSIYIRVPFQVADPAAYQTLTLRLKYDDGFVAYLNGHEVARRNAPDTPAWNSVATAEHLADQAVVYTDIPITWAMPYLTAGTNVLAIQGLNRVAGDNDFLILPELAEITVNAVTPQYFADPSPGAANGGDTRAFVADTKFSVDRGFYDRPIDVAITTDAVGATIRYTLDGTIPTATNGFTYTAPLRIEHTTTLRAYAYLADYAPTNVDGQTYIFLADVLTQTGAGMPVQWGTVAADYGMDPDVVNNPLYIDTILNDLKSIPTMSLVMDVNDIFGPNGLYSNPQAENQPGGTDPWERACSLELINPDGSDGFQINAGVRIYGGVGRDPSVMRHSFRFIFSSEYGETKLDYPLFADSLIEKFDTFILRANFNDAWNNMSWGQQSQYLRDEWARETLLAMGQPASHGTYVHLYINGLYWGLYNPVERPDSSFAASYFGGESEDYDALNSGEAIEGDRTAWDTTMRIANTGHVGTGYAYDANALAGSAAYLEIQKYVDLVNLTDYVIMNQYSGNWDWDGHNWYAVRQRTAGATWKFLPWDSEWILGGVGTDCTGTNNDNNPTRIFQQLRANADYRILFADRLYQHLFNGGALTGQAAADRYRALAAEIDRAIVGESARWGDLISTTPFTRDGVWLNEQNRLLNNYFPQQEAAMINLYRQRGLYPSINVPWFSSEGQTIPTDPPYFQLSMGAPAGYIYYTLDGSDPRLSGGGVSTKAVRYTGPVSLSESAMVRARVLNGTEWSAIHEAVFVLDSAPPVRVTEVMYHPADPPTGSPYTAEDFEYIEIQNISSTKTVHLGGTKVAGGVDFTFPTLDLAPGERIVVVSNQAAFSWRYGTGIRVAGAYVGNLNNAGERIRLESPFGGTFQDFEYKDGWYDITDGGGFSLVILNPQADLATWDVKESWRPSALINGSPGTADAGYAPNSVIINEVLAHQDTDNPGDWIELYNTTNETITIGGWYLSDDPLNLMKYRIATGTTIGAGQYKVFTEHDDFGNTGDSGCIIPFAMSELGDSVCLSSGVAVGVLGGYREQETFGANPRDVTIGRHYKSTGGTDFTFLVSPTRGGINAGPVVGPVVMSEIMYNPVIGGDPFIELYNPTGSVVYLYDNDPLNPEHQVNTWKFTNGIEFAFPQGASIQPGGYALIVVGDPAVYRATHNIPANVAIYGPWVGGLSNAGEAVELSRPGEPEPITGFVPYYRVDYVNYDDDLPWPTRADGLGSSLGRKVALDYGNDVANWAPSTADGTPGGPNILLDNTPPTVPTGLAATPTSASQVTLTWAASTDPESGIGYYQVYRNDTPIGQSTTTSFVDPLAVPGVAYTYQVSAVNRDGAEGSRSAVLPFHLVTVDNATAPTQTSVQVIFSETVDRDFAQNVANYTITPPVGAPLVISSAVVQPDNRIVLLTLSSSVQLGVTYTVTVNNVMSLSHFPVMPGSSKTFTWQYRGTGSILREYWTGIGGGSITDLTGNANYPNSPAGRGEVTSFEAPSDWADNYGTRMRGYVTAPQTGYYYLWIASDDNSELWLSSNENPLNKTKIAYVSGWTGSRAWDTYTSQKSNAVYLVAGNRYYIEALHVEGSGGDNVAVGWQLPDGTMERPIPGLRLSPFWPTPETTVTFGGIGVPPSDPSAAEYGGGTNKGTLTISRTGRTDTNLEVYYTVTGTASGTDYTPYLSGTVLMPAGTTFVLIDVVPIDDTVNEFDETVRLTLVSSASYAIGTSSTAQVVIADNEFAVVTGIQVNGRLDRGPSTVDPSGQGICTIDVLFNEAVTFSGSDVVLQTVTFPGGVETVTGTLSVPTPTGIGTNRMTISLASSPALDTWVKVTLKGNTGATLKDLQNHRLDGEAKTGGSGAGFVYSAVLDLPTGNGLQGGDTVFYVGSLRGDFCGTGGATPDGVLTIEDVAGFMAKYNVRSLDADFRGVGFGVRALDGRVTVGDIDGFLAAYQAGMAVGRRLDLLPGSRGPLLSNFEGPTQTLTELPGGLKPLMASVPGDGGVSVEVGALLASSPSLALVSQAVGVDADAAPALVVPPTDGQEAGGDGYAADYDEWWMNVSPVQSVEADPTGSLAADPSTVSSLGLAGGLGVAADADGLDPLAVPALELPLG